MFIGKWIKYTWINPTQQLSITNSAEFSLNPPLSLEVSFLIKKIFELIFIDQTLIYYIFLI